MTALFVAMVGLTVVQGAVPAQATVDRSQATLAPALPETVRTDVLPTVQINGVVWRQVIVGNTVYVGGEFSTARPAGAAPGVNETPRSNMLAYNLTTGEMLPSFAPTFNAKVVDLAVTPDQTKLIAVGPFTTVNGQPRSRVAVFDLPSGNLSSLAPAVNGGIETVAATNSTIFLGGYFSSVNGGSRARMASVRISNGQVLPFQPAIADGSVQSIVIAPDELSIVVAGNFTAVEGSGTGSGYGLARLDALSGRKLALPVGAEVRNAGQNAGILRLASDGTRFYGAGWAYGRGGNLEGFFAANWSDGQLAWLQDCHGDTYDIAPVDSVLYTVSHAHYCGNSGGFPQTSPGTNRHTGAWTNDVVRGVNKGDIYDYPDHPGTPRPEPLQFFPTMVAGTYTAAAQAGWTVTGNDDYVLIGGEFTRVGGTPQQGLVRMAVRGKAPSKRGPRLTSTGWAPTVRSLEPGSVRVQWQPNFDEDDTTLRYQVFRGTTSNVVYSTTQTARFWETTPMTFTDTGLTPASTVQYRVRAIDPDGNIASSDWVSVTVAGSGPPLDSYARAVLADGATTYWRFDESSGATVQDLSGADNPSTATGLVRGAPGVVPGNAATTFPGTTAGRVVSTQRIRSWGPQKFSVEGWFRTTAATGGKIIGFGQSATTASSSTFDRDLYLDSSRRVSFSLRGRSRVVLRTPGAYNDGQWHYVVGTYSQAAGAALYVDGRLVQTDTTLPSVREYNGNWRVGGDGTASGAQNFNGSIDEVAIYQDVLTPAQVADHWAASGRPAVPVNGAPVADFTFVERGLQVSFDASGSSDPEGPLTSYAWSFGDGTIATGATPQKTYSAPGRYPVTLTVTDGQGAVATYTLPVNVDSVNAPAVPRFSSSSDGLLASFDASASTDPDGTIESYAWTFGDGGTGSGPAPQYRYSEPGTYQVVLTVTDNLGATATTTSTITVTPSNQPPTAAFDVTYNGLDASFDASASGDPDGSVASYAWDFGDGTTGAGATTTKRYPAGGTYTVVLTVTDDDGAQASTSKTVTVGSSNTPPVADFTVSPSGLVATADASASYDPDGRIASYTWDFGDGSAPRSGATATHAYAFGGTYEVQLTVTDEGGASTVATRTVTVAAPVTLASDAFERAISNGWGSADFGGAWTLRGPSTAFSVSGGAGRLRTPAGQTLNADLNGVSSTQTLVTAEFSVDKNLESGYVALVGRQVGAEYYAGRIRLAADRTARLNLLQTAGGIGPAVTLPFLIEPGERYLFKVQVTGTSPTTVSAKVWKKGTPEPAVWQASGTNSWAALQTAGRVGAFSWIPSSAGTSARLTVSFSQLAVTEPS